MTWDIEVLARTSTRIGQRFGRLIVVGTTLEADKHGKFKLILTCDCGNETRVYASRLKRGDTKSCGCLRRERVTKHGKRFTPEYEVWKAMIRRCHAPNDKRFNRYGGRGINVCLEWRNSFESFIGYVGNRPKASYQLDRINNDDGYRPGNVRWVPVSVNARNRGNNRYFHFQGESLCLTDWASRFDISIETLRYRIDHGWPLEKALTERPNA